MLKFLTKFRRSFTSIQPQSTDDCIEENTHLLSALIGDSGTPLCVEDALANHPELRQQPRALIEIAIQEFNDRRENGEELSIDGFAARFPDIEDALRDSLLFEQLFHQISGCFEGSSRRRHSDDAWPEPGTVISGFRLVELLGRGGFSRVYLAEDQQMLSRRVAVKLCRQSAFEVHALADIQHSGIGAVHCVREDQATGFTAICMPVVSRVTLFDVIRSVWRNGRRNSQRMQAVATVLTENGSNGDPLGPWVEDSFENWVLDLAIHLSRALAASHREGIFHCDLKPSNILITEEGRPVLVDFNVAYRKSGYGASGNVGGTVPYMAPEQLLALAGVSADEIGAATDVFGLGATLYQLLTGELPFAAALSARNGFKQLLASRKISPPSIRQSNRAVDPEFDRIIRSCLAFSRHFRPDDAGALADQLESLRHRRITGEKKTRRLAAASVITAALFGIAGVVTAQKSDPDRALRDSVQSQLPEDANTLVKRGFDAIESGRTREADRLFRKAIRLDDLHVGAVLGSVRTSLRLGNKSYLRNMASYLHDGHLIPNGHPLNSTLEGLVLVAGGEFSKAAGAFDAANRNGFRSVGLTHDMGYCQYRAGEVDAAIQLLEGIRKRQSAPTSNLVLVCAYLNYWQRNRPANHRVSDSLASAADIQRQSEQLRELLEQCPPSIERARVGSTAYLVFGLTNGCFQGRRDEWKQWSHKSLDELQLGFERGLPHAFWFGVRNAFHPEVRAAAEDRFALHSEAEPAAGTPWQTFLMDPLAGTPYERYESRVIAPADLMTASLFQP